MVWATRAVEDSDVGLGVGVQRGELVHPSCCGGSVHLPRCSSESSGQAAGISASIWLLNLGREGSGFCWKGRS